MCKFYPFALDSGGDEENRTPDPLLARQVLSQLSYAPICLPFFHITALVIQSLGQRTTSTLRSLLHFRLVL